MQTTDVQELLLNILEQAQEGKLTEFKFITTWNEFISYWKISKSTKLVIRALRSGAKKLFKDYCSDVASGSADVNKLLTFSQLQDTIAFYENDLSTIKRMLDEYDDYLGKGNFWHSFLGGERIL